MTLLNGEGHACNGKRIDVVVNGKNGNTIINKCNTKEKPQISSGMIIWNTQDLEDKCKKTLFDPDKGPTGGSLTVSIRTHEWYTPFCPKKVELEILDIATNQPRYFCSQMRNQSGYKKKDNKYLHPAKEERCGF